MLEAGHETLLRLPDIDDDRHWVEQIILYTRHWMHYGFLFFVFFVVTIAAAAGLLQPR
ncbi:MAG: hypothetical protein JNK87_35375 [Bryobacterales bacterium]|nr:hypothetical protein [Bryobacterales bacterium]